MNAQVEQAARALEAALEVVREFESPVLTAADRAELDKIARRVAERLRVLNAEERRLALQ